MDVLARLHFHRIRHPSLRLWLLSIHFSGKSGYRRGGRYRHHHLPVVRTLVRLWHSGRHIAVCCQHGIAILGLSHCRQAVCPAHNIWGCPDFSFHRIPHTNVQQSIGRWPAIHERNHRGTHVRHWIGAVIHAQR